MRTRDTQLKSWVIVAILLLAAILVGLAVIFCPRLRSLVILPAPTRPTSTPNSPPTPRLDGTPTPIAKPPPIPTSIPSVRLERPENGSRLEQGSREELHWSCLYTPQNKEYFRLRVEGPDYSLLHYTTDDQFPLPILPPGEYVWDVGIVRATAQDEYLLISLESGWYGFEIVLPSREVSPSPEVYVMSPTSTLQGAGELVVFSGENLTRPLTVTIDGVALQPISVNPSTITVTIPVTLEVGTHTVLVKNSTGEDVWSAAFTVNAPPSPTPPPSTPIVALPYPAPTLCRPPKGYSFEKPTAVELGWDWQGQLGENEYFAVRVYAKGAPGHSLTWTTSTAYRVEELYGKPPGEYCWHIVVLRGTSHDNWTQLSPKSEEWCFYAVWPSKPAEPTDINDIAPTREVPP
jgi:hypothetical protein